MDGTGPDALVVFDGQSLNLQPDGDMWGDPYPRHLMSNRDVPWRNVAVSNTSWTSLSETASTRLHPLADSDAAKRILIMCGGTTDIDERDTGAELMADHVAYAEAARSAGFTHVIATTLVPSRGHDDVEDGHREEFNELLLADDGDHFDAVVDLAGSSLGDNTNTDYYLDGVHWYDPGARLAAELVEPHLEAILSE